MIEKVDGLFLIPGEIQSRIWDRVFKNEPSKICGRQHLKDLKVYGLPKQTIYSFKFLRAVFHKFYLIHS